MTKFEKIVTGLLVVIAVELGVLVGAVVLTDVVVEVEQTEEVKPSEEEIVAHIRGLIGEE